MQRVSEPLPLGAWSNQMLDIVIDVVLCLGMRLSILRTLVVCWNHNNVRAQQSHWCKVD